MQSSKQLNRNFLNFNNQPLLTCIGFISSCWRSLLEVRPLLKERVEQMKNSVRRICRNLKSGRFSNMTSLHALAVQVGVVHNSAAVVKAFPRIFVGLGCLVWLAPYADVFYTRLDFNDRVLPEVWYYESYHWLFLCLGPYLKGIFVTIGWYLILGHGNLIAKPIAAYQLMFDIGKVFWLLQVSNHEEYKSLPTNWFLVLGLITSVMLVMVIDRLAYWLNHRVEAIKRRLMGLRNIAYSVDAETFRTSVVKTMDDKKKVETLNA